MQTYNVKGITAIKMHVKTNIHVYSLVGMVQWYNWHKDATHDFTEITKLVSECSFQENLSAGTKQQPSKPFHNG